jgi:hypothetical protein
VNSDVKKDIQNMKLRTRESLKKQWETTVIHGQYVKSTDTQFSSEDDTFLWLSSGDVKAETESEIIAAK